MGGHCSIHGGSTPWPQHLPLVPTSQHWHTGIDFNRRFGGNKPCSNHSVFLYDSPSTGSGITVKGASLAPPPLLNCIDFASHNFVLMPTSASLHRHSQGSYLAGSPTLLTPSQHAFSTQQPEFCSQNTSLVLMLPCLHWPVDFQCLLSLQGLQGSAGSGPCPLLQAPLSTPRPHHSLFSNLISPSWLGSSHRWPLPMLFPLQEALAPLLVCPGLPICTTCPANASLMLCVLWHHMPLLSDT